MLQNEKLTQILERMILIRTYEEELLKLVREQKSPGICPQSGQEACAVGVVEALKQDDIVITNHRNAGHLLARGADPGKMLAEVMGKATGYCKGKSGTLHISVKELNVYLTSTIVGGELSFVPGVGLSLSLLEPGKIVACFFGDGAACEGTFHESLNLASVWKLPILYFCENNQWQAYVSRKETMAVDHISERAKGYGIPGKTVDGNDIAAVYEAAKEAVEWIRSGKGPYLLEGYTYRLKGHYEPDDQSYVPKDELELWRKKDPIQVLKSRLMQEKALTESQYQEMEQRVNQKMKSALEFAFHSPYPNPEELTTDVYA